MGERRGPGRAACAILICATGIVASPRAASGQALDLPPRRAKGAGLDAECCDFRWCRYVRRDLAENALAEVVPAAIAMNETEPNDTTETAQGIPLGTGVGQDTDVDIQGTVNPGTDIDLFRFTARKGDILGAATAGVSPFDAVIYVYRADGTPLVGNDDHQGIHSIYPTGSPWPTPAIQRDAAMTFVVPSDGDYLIVVLAFAPEFAGNYTLRLRLRRPSIEIEESPSNQILFLDFDGATINVGQLFGVPVGQRTLSPLSSFLGAWGLTAGDENAVINAIIASVQEIFDDLRRAELNGDFPADVVPGHFDIDLRNSRDHPDPFGSPNVSRIIVGGTISQLGISTIGIAQFIDPGNYSRTDTGVVLLDLLSAASDSFPNCCTINEMPRAGGFTRIQLIGRVVGNIIAHEAGHYLGNWHTRNDNTMVNIMDEGGELVDFSGAGPNGVSGDGDDIAVRFITDEFSFFENIGLGMERTEVRTAFALATGGRPPLSPTVIDRFPPVDSALGVLETVAVTFSESVVGVNAGSIVVNGSAATSFSGFGAGPYSFTGFTSPPDGPVEVQVMAGAIMDQVGHTFSGDQWALRIKDCNGNGVLDDDDIAAVAGAGDCNRNGFFDECDPDLLTAKTAPALKLNMGDGTALDANALFVGGTPPLSFKWTLRGIDGEESNMTDAPNFSPKHPGTYVARVVAEDAFGCNAVAYLTIIAGEGASGEGLAVVEGVDCGAGTCGATSGAMLTALFAACLGLAGVMRRRRPVR